MHPGYYQIYRALKQHLQGSGGVTGSYVHHFSDEIYLFLGK
jgi:hypothetical protein